jgi:hypothetical protein
MSTDQNADKTVNQPVPNPNLNPNPGVPSGGALNLDSPITVGGKAYTVAELLEARKNLDSLQGQVSELKQYKENAGKLLTPTTPKEEQAKSMRYLMTQQGYTPQQIEEYIGKTFSDDGGQGDGADDTAEGGDPRLDEVMQAVEQQRRELVRMNLENLNKQVTGGLEQALQDAADSKLLLEKVGQRDKKDAETVRQSIIKDARARLVRSLEQRKALTGKFDPSWIGEESKKAVAEATNIFKAVVGDFKGLGRAPSVGEDLSSLLDGKPPVAPPNPKGRKDEVLTGLRDYNRDRLLRAAAETASQGGNSYL